jgi:ribosomal peptide maturation radical SAM protein 1
MMTNKTVLVSMPWQALESPSLPLALLRSACRGDGQSIPLTYHGGIKWCEHLMAESGGEIGVREYTEIAENGLFDGIGDWIFTGVLHDDPNFGVREFTEYATGRNIDVPLVSTMRGYAQDFIKRVADEILALKPDIVGFTTTFMQNVPSLALARHLDAVDSSLLVVFGGGNCDGDMGVALHRNFEFVDIVLRGEGERSFPQLLRALNGNGALDAVPGLCWRSSNGIKVNSARAQPLPPNELPTPDFDDWFEVIESSPVAQYIEPQLVVETSRGCWWGEKHQCTFCGLNGSLMKFRSKTPDRALSEITELVSKYQVLDIITVDNIIDNSYFNTVLPLISELGWDLRIHYEVKSNLTSEQIARCKSAGIAHVQPGIESLVSPVLKIMDKGVSAIRNVRTLRDCESASLTVSWNWLYGFPGERLADYLPVVKQLPALRHLQPPTGAARILLERFSPYFENPALGFIERAPAYQYRYLYNLPPEAVFDMVYLFDTLSLGLSEDEVVSLRKSIHEWIDAYRESALETFNDNGDIIIIDRRVGWPATEHRITERVFIEAYHELENGRSVNALLRILRDRHKLSGGMLRDWLGRLAEHGLIFQEGEHYLALATQRVPVKIATL